VPRRTIETGVEAAPDIQFRNCIYLFSTDQRLDLCARCDKTHIDRAQGFGVFDMSWQGMSTF